MISALRQLFTALLIAVVPVALLETGLRIVGWPTQRVRSFDELINLDALSWRESIGVFEPSSRARILWPPELSYEVEINSLGLRGPEIAKRAPPRRTRILALGDSMTFGYYLEEPETWPVRLQGHLRKAELDAEVVNGGSGGWSIDSQTLFLDERAVALAPDHVVVAFSADDIAELDSGRVAYESQKSAVGRSRNPVAEMLQTSALYELFLRARVGWEHWRVVQSGTLRRPLTSADVPAERADELWKEYGEWLDRMISVLALDQIELTLVYVPDAYKLANGLPAEDEARLRELAADRAIGFVSPLAAFEPRPRQELFLLPLDDHLSPQGADLMARKLADALIPQLGGRPEETLP